MDLLDLTFLYTPYLSVFSPNAGKCGKNADQNNSEYGHFLRSVLYILAVIFEVTIEQNLIIDDIITYFKIYSKQYNKPNPGQTNMISKKETILI